MVASAPCFAAQVRWKFRIQSHGLREVNPRFRALSAIGIQIPHFYFPFMACLLTGR